MSLIDDAKAARKHGVDYGIYMATIKEPPPASNQKDAKVCAFCGKPLKGRRVKFCSDVCRLRQNTNTRKGDKFV